MQITHSEAKILFTQINGSKDHEYHKLLNSNRVTGRRYLDRLREIVGSGRNGSLDKELVTFHQQLQAAK